MNIRVIGSGFDLAHGLHINIILSAYFLVSIGKNVKAKKVFSCL